MIAEDPQIPDLADRRGGANEIRITGPHCERAVSGRNRNDRVGEEDDLEKVVE
jgi:hypothetical protein